MSKWKLSHISAGLTAVTVGYSSSVVIIIDVARKAGASDDMVVSWLLALGLGGHYLHSVFVAIQTARCYRLVYPWRGLFVNQHR